MASSDGELSRDGRYRGDPAQVIELSKPDPVSGEPRKTTFTFDGWLDSSNGNAATLEPDGVGAKKAR